MQGNLLQKVDEVHEGSEEEEKPSGWIEEEKTLEMGKVCGETSDWMNGFCFVKKKQRCGKFYVKKQHKQQHSS